MIFVGGLPFEGNSSQGSDILTALMDHPVLVSAALSFKAIPEKELSSYELLPLGETKKRKHVYIFQREYATVDPALVDFIGTDEATTCVGLVIRNGENGLTSLAHMDSPEATDIGLSQMLAKVVGENHDVKLDVHLVGGFEDVPSNKIQEIGAGYSFPLCAKVVEALWKRTEHFHLHTLFVLGHNTRRDTEGNPYPIFNGLLVETSTGSVLPACFDKATRCPDELIRRIRVSGSFGDLSWKGKLLDTYDTETDQFIIAPCYWSIQLVCTAYTLQELPDSEILQVCSTSPSAEAPDFVENQRRLWEYLIQHPKWTDTFRMGRPRTFKRTNDGGWTNMD